MAGSQLKLAGVVYDEDGTAVTGGGDGVADDEGTPTVADGFDQ